MAVISFTACVSTGEEVLLAHGLNDVLATAVAHERAQVRFSVAGHIEALTQQCGSIRIISLQRYLDGVDLPWAETQLRVRKEMARIAEAGDPVFLLTIFRCVPDRGSEMGQALLAHIRRLNLEAAELSRTLGVFVVDLDRILADIGGMALGTDYRLESGRATATGGREFALCVAMNGMDAFLPFDAQERVKAQIESRSEAARPVMDLSPANLVALGEGRRRQHVEVTTDAVQDSHVNWLVSQVFSGRIEFGEAARRLGLAIRRRGARASLRLVLAAMLRSTLRQRPA